MNFREWIGESTLIKKGTKRGELVPLGMSKLIVEFQITINAGHFLPCDIRPENMTTVRNGKQHPNPRLTDNL